MKYLCILLLLSLSLTTVFSRGNEIQKGKENTILSNTDLVESVISYSTTGNNSKYSYTYDTFGNILTFLYQKFQNVQWENYNRTTFTYDSNGNPLTSLMEKW